MLSRTSKEHTKGTYKTNLVSYPVLAELSTEVLTFGALGGAECRWDYSRLRHDRQLASEVYMACEFTDTFSESAF